jgi:hypothetical protein
MHVLDQQLVIHRQMLWYTFTSFFTIISLKGLNMFTKHTSESNNISQIREITKFVLDQQLVIHRQMLWNTFT